MAHSPRIYWREDTIHTEPGWSVNLDISVIEAIARDHLLPNTTGELTVAFLGEGSFNKAYTVDVKTTSSAKSYVFRATLPIEPSDKVRNEVATINYIKQHTSIPVPAVIAYDSSSDNPLGFEWTLMEKIPGKALSDVWYTLSDASKAAITREIAGFVLQIRKNCIFHQIGALYHDDDKETLFTIGPIITQFAFMGARRQLLTRNRGPYHHDSDFVRALIDIQVADVHLVKTMSQDDPNFDKYIFRDGPGILRSMERLLSLVPEIFANDQRDVPFYILMHPDLSHSNIMIDPDTLKITGIIDWECTNASPPWEHPYPQFLMGPEVTEEADRVEPGNTSLLLNELWDNWEKMRLRKIFDEVAGPLVEEPLAVLKREFMEELAIAEESERLPKLWVMKAREELDRLASARMETRTVKPLKTLANTMLLVDILNHL